MIYLIRVIGRLSVFPSQKVDLINQLKVNLGHHLKEFLGLESQMLHKKFKRFAIGFRKKLNLKVLTNIVMAAIVAIDQTT